jgi:hypothetical protein
MQEYFSEFNLDNSLLQSMLDDSSKKELVNGAKELAVSMNLRLACKRNDPHALYFYTPRGLYAGSLQYCQDYTKSDHEYFFMYHNRHVIRKEKASSRSDKFGRDSHKVTGIIAALKKNKEIPDDKTTIRNLSSGLSWAFRTGVERNVKSASITLESRHVVALLKAFIESNKYDAEADREVLVEKYNEYLDTLRKNEEHMKDGQRFKEGTFVGMIPDAVVENRKIYVVGEASYDTTGKVVFGEWRRYKSLADSPIAHIAMMIRESRRGMDEFNEDNELGLRLGDRYIEDLDISTGWATTADGLWVVIPKHGA